MAQIVINNIVWENVSVTMLGSINDLVTKIEYKRTGNHVTNYAAGSEPIGIGKGKYTYTASIEMYQEAWQAIYAASGGNPLSLLPFDIAISVLPTEDSPILFPYTDTLYNCVFLEDGMTTQANDTKIMINIPLLITGFSRFQ